LPPAGARLAVHGLATREQADAEFEQCARQEPRCSFFSMQTCASLAAITAMMDAIETRGGPGHSRQ
jgi:hypothetical protein